MKKSILFFFTAFLTLGITTSCSNNDDDSNDGSNINHSAIQGKWKFYELIDIEGGEEISEIYEHLCASKPDNLFFTSSTWANYYYDENCAEETEGGSYSINGNTLTVSGVEEGVPYTETAEIMTLDAHTLKIKETEVYQGETYVFIQVLKKM